MNLKLKDSFVRSYVEEMDKAERFGLEAPEKVKTIVLDYGGPNVAKPLHVGHLRSAVIGESIKRICRYKGHHVIGDVHLGDWGLDYGGPNVAKPLHVGHLRSAVIGESIKRICRYKGHHVIGDVHLGDWGLQMGLIITELKERKPELPYFDENFTGEYPEEAPFTVAELEEIYPTASGKSKEDAAYKEAALEATLRLQSGDRGYRALWNHIIAVSVTDLKKNYSNLNVEFDLWKGESDADPFIPGLVQKLKESGLASVTDLKKNYSNLNVEFDLWKGESDADPFIPGLVQKLKESGLAHESQGALVVDVKEETDTKEIPPCIILKSDGAALYATTDLATIEDRMENLHADSLIYLTLLW